MSYPEMAHILSLTQISAGVEKRILYMTCKVVSSNEIQVYLKLLRGGFLTDLSPKRLIRV